MDFSHHIMHTIQHIIKCEQDIMTMMHQMFLFLTIRQLWRSISLRMYSIVNLSLNKFIMCLAIVIHSKLILLLIMNKKTKFDLINPAQLM